MFFYKIHEMFAFLFYTQKQNCQLCTHHLTLQRGKVSFSNIKHKRHRLITVTDNQDGIEDHTHNQRGLYFDMKDSPYWAASTPEALDRLIESCTPDKAKANCEAILKFYGTHECGHAAETVARYIIEKLHESPVAKHS